MGQGLFDVLGWGRIDPPVQVDADNYVLEIAAMDTLIWERLVEASSETEPPCLVIPLAVSEPWLQDDMQLPPLPAWVPRIEPRRARYVSAPASFVVPEAAQTRWREVQGIYQRAGMRLPRARLVLLNDWD
jgi:hypothetical protein